MLWRGLILLLAPRPFCQPLFSLMAYPPSAAISLSPLFQLLCPFYVFPFCFLFLRPDLYILICVALSVLPKWSAICCAVLLGYSFFNRFNSFFDQAAFDFLSPKLCALYAIDRTVRPIWFLALPRGKSLLSNLTSSSDHKIQLFFLISTFSIAVIVSHIWGKLAIIFLICA